MGDTFAGIVFSGQLLLAIPVAMLALLNPILAAAAMSLSSVSVLTNALRLKRFKVTQLNKKGLHV